VSQLGQAISGLEVALGRSRRSQLWHWLVGHRLATAREVLASEDDRAADEWLASRQAALVRERDALLLKVDHLTTRLAEDPNLEALRGDLQRLVTELRRHHQRINDLAWDTVALDLGGSE
jgi:hypothetical protein